MRNIYKLLIVLFIANVVFSCQKKDCQLLVNKLKNNDSNFFLKISKFDSSCINYIDHTNHGYTPLMYAMEKGQKRIVKDLIRNGANLATLTYNIVPTHDAFYIAVENDFLWGVKYFVEAGFDPRRELDNCENAIFTCARNNSVNTLRYLVEFGLNLNQPNEDYFGFGSRYAIHDASTYNNPDIIEVLINNGVNIEQKGFHGYTPLMSACSVFEPANDAIKFLLKRGANPNCVTSNGYSALMLTCSNKNLTGARLLIKNGADLNLVTDEGKSALHYCVQNGQVNVDIIKVLITNGINKTLKNYKGQTAFDVAKDNNIDSEALRLLK